MTGAVCILVSAMVAGTLLFTPQPYGGIRITGTITGLSPGKHGFHIHQYGDLRDGCKAAGGHFNPLGNSHGGPTDRERHVGDLGNIVASNRGVAEVDIIDHTISLYGFNNIIGKAVVVHAGEDDLGRGQNIESTKTGNAGPRLACGVIGTTAWTQPSTAQSRQHSAVLRSDFMSYFPNLL